MDDDLAHLTRDVKQLALTIPSVMDAMRKKGSEDVAALARALGLEERDVRLALQVLENQDMVTSTRYKITAKGHLNREDR
jgi:predicted transcriptional regulator